MNELALTKQLQIKTLRSDALYYQFSTTDLKYEIDPAVITVDTHAVMFGCRNTIQYNTIQYKHVSSHATHPLLGFNMPQILDINYARVSPTACGISVLRQLSTRRLAT
jgi:hypothetical protein